MILALRERLRALEARSPLTFALFLVLALDAVLLAALLFLKPFGAS